MIYLCITEQAIRMFSGILLHDMFHFYCYSDGELYQWGLYGKPVEQSDDDTFEQEREQENDVLIDEGQKDTSHRCGTGESAITEETVEKENGSENRCDVKEIRPFHSSFMNFTGEYEGQEEVMKDMGLPLSFARSPRDFEEEVNIDCMTLDGAITLHGQFLKLTNFQASTV